MESFVPDTRPESGDIRVLHVDDNDQFVEMVSEQLSAHDDSIEVISATDSESARERLDEDDVDCVVSDYRLPETDGLELLRTVREDDEGLPFFLFTGKGSEDVASEAISAGVTDYLQKSGSSETFELLANWIETAVEKYRAQREIETLKRRYELVAKSTADALWDWIIGGQRSDREDIVRRSEGYCRSFGYDEDEISDRFGWWTDRVHPDDREDAIAALDETLANGDEFYEDTYRFRHADGSYSWVLSRGYVEYEDDDPVYMIGSVIDQGDRPNS